MRLHEALAIGLLSTAYAAPVTPPVRLLASFPDSPDSALCGRKDAAAWKDFGMKAFIEQEAKAQVTEAYTTQPGNPEKKKSFLNLLVDTIPQNNWTCTSDALPCQPKQLDGACAKFPKQVRAIEATQNYVNFLNTAGQELDKSIGEVVAGLAAMQGKFNPSTKSEIGSNPLDSLAAGMGIVGTLASLISGPAGAYTSAVLSIAGSAMSAFGPKPEDKLEVKFEGFAHLGDGLRKIVREVNGAIARAKQDVFTLVVPRPATRILPDMGIFGGGETFEYNTDPGYVSNVIAEGTFAVAQSSDWIKIRQEMNAALNSQVINVLWKKENVVVVKISKGSFTTAEFEGVDPCDPKQPDIMLPRGTKYCDAQGNMFVVQARPANDVIAIGQDKPIDDKLYAVPGFEELGDYDLTPKDVITSSWRNKAKVAPNAEASKQVLSEYITNGATNPLPFFNLHTCDLDLVTTWADDWCRPEYRGLARAWCTFYGKIDNCGSIKHGVDADGKEIKWPWEKFPAAHPPMGA